MKTRCRNRANTVVSAGVAVCEARANDGSQCARNEQAQTADSTANLDSNDDVGAEELVKRQRVATTMRETTTLKRVRRFLTE